MENLLIQTQNHYKSMFAKRTFARGEVIRPLPCTAVHDAPTQHTVQVGHNRHIEIGKMAYINHSCNPNVIFDTARMLIIAAREIAPSEELTFFYPSTEWEMVVPFICLCGTPSCIHVVAGARFLPLSVLENYYINDHLREMIIEHLNTTKARLPELIPSQA
jgi:hypothetical protein